MNYKVSIIASTYNVEIIVINDYSMNQIKKEDYFNE
jgi:hypothetical protein